MKMGFMSCRFMFMEEAAHGCLPQPHSQLPQLRSHQDVHQWVLGELWSLWKWNIIQP